VTTLADLINSGRALVSVEEAGEALGLKRGSAYLAVKNNQIPSVRLGRRRLVPTAALARLCQVEPSS
jgi:excisionase family DNA binding protein